MIRAKLCQNTCRLKSTSAIVSPRITIGLKQEKPAHSGTTVLTTTLCVDEKQDKHDGARNRVNGRDAPENRLMFVAVLVGEKVVAIISFMGKKRHGRASPRWACIASRGIVVHRHASAPT